MLSQKTVGNIGGHFGKVHVYVPSKPSNSGGQVKKRKIDVPKVSVTSLPKRLKSSVPVKKKKKLAKKNISKRKKSKPARASKVKKKSVKKGRKVGKVKTGRKLKGGATRKGKSLVIARGIGKRIRKKKSAIKAGYGSIFG